MKNILKKTAKAGISVLFLFGMLMLFGCKAKKRDYVGLWIHTCNGEEESIAFWDSDERAIATEELLDEDGTFGRNWVEKYWTRGGTRLKNGELAKNVSVWGSGNGNWEIRDDGMLIFNYEETTGEDYYQVLETEFNKDRTVLKVDGKSYKKSE